MISCPNCRKGQIHTLGTSKHLWCSLCGTLMLLADGLTGHGERHFAEVRKPSRKDTPGLLAVATDAVERVNDRTAKGTRHTVDSFADLAEAISAIIHELALRDDERPPTAADRADIRDFLKTTETSALATVILQAADAVRHERERCADMVDQYGTDHEDHRTAMRVLAATIRMGAT